MLHTYRPRESSWPEGRLLRTLAKIYYYACVALFRIGLTAVAIGVGCFFWTRPSGWVTGELFMAVGAVVILPLAAYWLRTQCTVIRLGDDGTCEFETRWRVVRAHVAQIASIEEEVDEDGDLNYYLRFRDRRMLWTEKLGDFEDFLTRIKAMNPAIDIKRA